MFLRLSFPCRALVFAAALAACKLESRARVQSINRMNDGVEMFGRKNYDAAVQALQEAIQVDPTHARAHAYLGQAYEQQGKLVEAEKEFRLATETMNQEPNADYFYNLGAVILRQSEAANVPQEQRKAKMREALAAFEGALKLQPDHYKSHYRKGAIHEKLDEPKQADAAYRKTIEVRSSYSPAFVALGNMYIDYGFANVAMAVLDIGAKLNSKDAAMWNGLGRAHLSLGKSKEAIDAFTTAKTLDPAMVDALFGLGMAYAAQQNRPEAIAAFKEFLTRAGSDVPDDKKRAASDTMARLQDVM